MTPKRFGALSSSVDPDKLAATVTGFIKLAAGAAVYFGALSQTDGNVLVDNVTTLVSAAFMAWGAAEAIFGIIRKVVVAYAAKS